MKLLFDLFPIVLFFAAYKFQGIFVATAVAIAATFAQIGWVWFRHRKVEPMLWMSLVIITVFGGATLFLHNEAFIKWKPTVLYWLMAAVLVGSQALFRRNLIAALLKGQLDVPPHVWFALNLAWAGFFAALGGLNLYVAFHYSTDAWVNFKLFGTLGLMVAFIVAQGAWLSRYLPDSEKS